MNIGLNGKAVYGTTTRQKATVGQRRSNIEIIADMLRVGENGAGKTEIMYTANMSYNQIQKYLEYLVTQGFINKVNIDDTMIAYQITETGLKLLKAIDTLLEMLESNRDSGQH
jgi:predicted transcriptional regulator